MRIALSRAKVSFPTGSTLEQVNVVSAEDGTIAVRDRTGTLVATLVPLDVMRPTGDSWQVITADGVVQIDRMLGGGCGCGR